MRHRMTISEAADLMEQWQSSGLCVKQFCIQSGINKATFYYWRQRLKEDELASSTTFLPINFAQPDRGKKIQATEKLEFIYPNGVRLSLSSNCDLNLIRQLIHIA